MKLKNVTTLEKHFEKILIGVTLLILSAVTYFYVLNGTTVKIDGQEVEPQKIDELIYQKAQRLQDALKSPDLPKELETLTVTQYMQAFSKKYSERLMPEDSVSISLNQPAIFPPDDQGGAPKPFFALTPPTPEIIAQRADLGSIDPNEPANNTDLARILPDAAPFDTAWVSVVGRFDMATMVKNLNQPEDDNFKAIPNDWWVGKFGILDVQMERQELDENGNWSKPKLVDPMPGAITFRYLPPFVNPKEAPNYIEIMNKWQQALVRPQFFNLIGKPWTPPEPDEDKPVGDRKEDLKLNIRKKREKIELFQRQIDKMRVSAPGTPGATSGAGAPPPITGLPSGAGPGGIPRPTRPPVAGGVTPPAGHHAPPPAVRVTGREKQIASLTEKVTKLQSELRDLETEYVKLTGEAITPVPGAPGAGFGPSAIGPGGTPLGGPPPGAVGPGFRPAPGASGYVPGPGGFIEPGLAPGAGLPRAAVEARVVDLLGGSKTDLWANDMSVAQGKTYRYRVRVLLVNPFFNKLNEKANKDFKHFTMASEWSEWGKPVTIERMKYFFVANAAPNGQARIDVWRFYQGNWFNHEFAVRAGDPVGGPINLKIDKEDLPVDFFTGAYIVDMDTLVLPPAKAGDPPKKTTRVMFLVDNEMTSRRMDLDKTDPKRGELHNMQTPAAGGPAIGAAGQAALAP